MTEPSRPLGAPNLPPHTPVLLAEVLALLNPQPGQAVLDCTLGYGGHAAALAHRIGPTGQLWAIDRDAVALREAEKTIRALAAPPTLHLIHGNFADVVKLLHSAEPRRFNAVLADLGVSSRQFDDPARGFSFRHDAPLDMRMDARPRSEPSPGLPVGRTAADLINEESEEDLARIFYEFGEERKSRQIADAIIRERRLAPIRTTKALADLCARVLRRGKAGPGSGSGSGSGGRDAERIHPATRVFQALRIAVNGELSALDALLKGLPEILAEGGRAAFISFHSLEDRRVKESLKFWRHSGRCKVETPKPVQASTTEIYRNPRSRSAKLRGLSAWTATGSAAANAAGEVDADDPPEPPDDGP